MKYKLICFDLDGTLLDHDFKLPPAYQEEFQRLRQAGYRITVATGRNFQGAQKYVEALGITEPMIFSNGCEVRYPGQACQVLFGVPQAEALEVVALQWDFELSVKVHLSGGRLYKSKALPWPHEVTHFPIGEVRSDLASLIDQDPIKIVAHGPHEEMERFRKALLEHLGADPKIRLFRSHDYYLEITHAQVSKGAALQRLAQEMGISSKEIVTLGDQENDYEMLQGFGLGIQVGNHCEMLNEVADFSLPGPEELGLVGLGERLSQL